MKNAKTGRLAFSLVLLFSVFLFMGTAESTGCFDCDPENNASFIINNRSSVQQKVLITGPTAKEVIVGINNTATVWVKQGFYIINAYGAPFYNSSYYSSVFTMTPSTVQTINIED